MLPMAFPLPPSQLLSFTLVRQKMLQMQSWSSSTAPHFAVSALAHKVNASQGNVYSRQVRAQRTLCL